MATQISLKDMREQSLPEHKGGIIPVGGLEFESDDARSRYLLSVFPGLVKEGKFVQAMELVHGNGSFNGFYRLIDKFSNWLAKKTGLKTAAAAQSVQERILDQAA